jgi:hypothetical protein
MTTEQKISILIRKYGSKSVIRDNSAPLIGDANSFSNNKVLPEQIWVDLKSVPDGKNPLLNSPVDLSTWPSGSNSPIIVKIIKKQLTWIPGTNAFYDPSDPDEISTVKDVISPDVDLSYNPYVYVLNTQSNRYLHHISPGEYNWVFDYETGCLVFVNGLPSFMKSPQFQPPAITCYRYLGRKTADGLSSSLVQGPTGPTGPTGITGPTNTDEMVWKGQYDGLLDYSVNDVVFRDGIIWVKATGPTGPTDFTSAYFDSITYNELVDGFINTLNEQYIDVEYTVNETPYFESLDDLSALLSSDLSGIGDELKNNDQNINIFNVTGAQDFYSKTFVPYSNRLYFFSPKKLTSAVEVYLEGAGYRMLSVEGLRAGDANITTQSFLDVSRSKLTGNGSIQFLTNSSIVPTGTSDVSSTITDSLFQDYELVLNGSSRINSCDFQGCNIQIGDPGFNSPIAKDVYNGVVHYFQDTRFIDSTFELVYTGEYPNVVIVFDRCTIVDSRVDADDAGFTFPNRPNAFALNNPNAIIIKVIFIDTAIACDNSNFNYIGGSKMTVIGSNVVPSRINQPQNTIGFVSGVVTADQTLNAFLQRQNAYSLINPRATTNFYFNQ